MCYNESQLMTQEEQKNESLPGELERVKAKIRDLSAGLRSAMATQDDWAVLHGLSKQRRAKLDEYGEIRRQLQAEQQ